jgi:hypothetical protein
MHERKTNRRSYYPGGGEFIAAKSEGWKGQFTQQDYLRGYFWVIVVEMFPDLQRSLRAIYDEKLAKSLTDLFHSGRADFFLAARSLAWPALKTWAASLQLGNDWCIDRFLSKVYEWLPESPTGERIGTLEIEPAPFKPLAFQLPSSAWDPTEKPASAFKTEMRDRLKAALDQYCDQMRNAVLAAGYVRNSERRQREHFYWLAGYQVRGWSQSRIAEAAGVDQAAACRAINELAREIELTSRPKRGNDLSWTVERIRAALPPPVTSLLSLSI